ncbi:hypothetical protein [Pseudomonas sp.]|uniref:hypothetical protein n=1 Tax=Pseudomonas sp. TaxID=306 RepID=UPI003FD760B7
MNKEQRARMTELDAAASAAIAAQRDFAMQVYPKGCLVRVHHSRGSFEARVENHDRNGHQLTVVNCKTGKATYAYPGSSRTNTWAGEPWESNVEFLEGPRP